MLEAGAAALREAGRRDVVFADGDATALPFADAQFDVVVCRFAFHHIDEPAQAAAEMARVARPGGLVAVVDMVSEPGAPGARHNELERLRDPSHTRALEEPELISLLEAAGVHAATVAERVQRLPARPLARARGVTRGAARGDPRRPGGRGPRDGHGPVARPLDRRPALGDRGRPAPLTSAPEPDHGHARAVADVGGGGRRVHRDRTAGSRP